MCSDGGTIQSSGFENLSNELFEYIAQELDLRSLCNLRLVSREVAHRATQGTFHSCFQKARVKLEKISLKAFARVTSGPLGSHIKELTIVGIVYDFLRLQEICSDRMKMVPDQKYDILDPPMMRTACTDSEVAEAQHDLELLRRSEVEYALLCHEGHSLSLLRTALRNMAGSRGRTLESLTLEIIVKEGAPTEELQPREARIKRSPYGGGTLEEQLLGMASTTFVASITALSTSGLSVSSMNVFHTRPGSLRCSLPCDTLAVFKKEDFLPLGNTKSLFISISDKLTEDLDDEIGPEYDEEKESRTRAAILDQAKSPGLSTLIASCVRLQHLHISFYEPNGYKYKEEHDSVRVEQAHKLLQANLPSLQTFSIGGVEVQIADLMDFLNRHNTTLQSIEMTVIMIYDGLLSNVLSLIAGESFPQLNGIHLTDVNDKDTVAAYFHREQRGEHTTVDGVFYENIIHRRGPDTKKVITYSAPRHRRGPSGKHAIWREHIADQFGRHKIHYKRTTPEQRAQRSNSLVTMPVIPRRYPRRERTPRLP